MAERGEALSEREQDVLECLASGASNKEIAAALSISQNTVKVHLRNIYTKLGASSRTEATTAAIQQGVLTVPGMEQHDDPEPTAVATPTSEPEPENEADPDSAESLSPPLDPRPTPITDTPAVEPAGRSRQQGVLIGLLLVLALAVVGLIGWRIWENSAEATPPTPFEEVALGDTRWFASRPMPDARAGMASAVVGLNVYQIGGETAEGIDGAVHVFNTTDRTWQPAARKPTPVTDASAVELFGEIYVVGGIQPDGTATAAVEAYSPLQDAWRPVAALPQPLAGGLALTDGAFLYLFGGSDGSGVVDTAFVYDPGVDSWRPIAKLPQALAYATGGSIANQLYVVGGSDGSDALDQCSVYDTTTDMWAECPPMLEARAGAGSAVIVNRLYVLGGNASFGELYDPNTETWQVVNLPDAGDSAEGDVLISAETVGQRPAITSIETRIFVQGGQHDDGLLDTNLVYAPLVYQTFLPATTSEE